MNCEKFRECLYAFLDDELESGVSMEVQAHLEHCPACAREAEIERAIRRGLVRALSVGGVSELDEGTLVRSLAMSADRRPARPVRLMWFLGTALAVAAAIAMMVSFWPTRSGSGAGGFIDLVADESGEFLAHAGPVQLATSEVGTLTAWLRDQTALSVEIADLSASGWRLIGGRRCSLDGLPAAFALFERDGKTASVVAVSDGHVDMGDLKRTPCGQEVHWVGHCKGRNIVANHHGGLVYFAVSDHPASELHDLVMEPHR